MVYTVTCNPSLDYIVSVEQFQKGRVNRSCRERLLPGGKGLNVSMTLFHLGVESRALGFVAGFTGQEIVRQVERMGVTSDFISLANGTSRINIKLKAQEETEINGCGPQIEAVQIKALMEKISALRSGDILVLAGSLPNSAPDDLYCRIMRKLSGRNVKIVVDAERELLTRTLACRPFLIKPNREELGELFGETIATKEAALFYAKKLQEMGAVNVLVSLAGEGAVFAAEDGSVLEADAPKGRVLNSVGAGDAMIAGFLAGWLRKQDNQTAFYMGVAAGSASAFSDWRATGEEIEAMYRQISANVTTG